MLIPALDRIPKYQVYCFVKMIYQYVKYILRTQLLSLHFLDSLCIGFNSKDVSSTRWPLSIQIETYSMTLAALVNENISFSKFQHNSQIWSTLNNLDFVLFASNENGWVVLGYMSMPILRLLDQHYSIQVGLPWCLNW